MKIKEITYSNRRDFKAIYVCEGCEHEKEDWGYDDSNFHNNVIPEMKCDNCGKSGIELKVKYEARATRYPEGVQV